MAVKLSLFPEKDVEGKPALFRMLVSFTDDENPNGLGGEWRTFLFAADLVDALAPLRLEPGFLRDITNDLEQGKGHLFEISNEQAAAIGMLPQRGGFQWVQTTIRRTEKGDGSFFFSVSYQVRDQTVHGQPDVETLAELEAHVIQFVALDWAAIGTQLESHDTSSTVLNLPDETVRYIFDGEL